MILFSYGVDVVKWLLRLECAFGAHSLPWCYPTNPTSLPRHVVADLKTR